MRLVIGDRVIEGQIQEREEARRSYEQAKEDGQVASLVEQQRPNVFTTSLANIAPRDQVEVMIEFQQLLEPEGGEYELRFPMVVAPRYSPSSEGAQAVISSQVNSSSPNRLSLAISLDMGLPLEYLESAHHQISISRLSHTGHRISLSDETVRKDRDFVLRWAIERGPELQASLFVEEINGEYYALLMAEPPASAFLDSLRLPRELILVIDTSGSMKGDTIVQVRKSIRYALQQLRPDDYLNIIRFDDDAQRLFPESRQAFPATVDEAMQWVKKHEAEGGTEMPPALRAALDDDAELGLVRQVMFVTDGAVRNEEELFRTIGQELGQSRLFTVGIGSAPNSHFMAGAASFGRDSSTHIGSSSEVKKVMAATI